jgi:hypothetical protein
MRNQRQSCISTSLAFLLLSWLAIGNQLFAQECPPNGTVIQGAFDPSGQTMPARLFRDGVASTCTSPKVFPGVQAGTNLFETFEFRNFGIATCVTATLDVGNCDREMHLMAYLDSFDPNSLSTNYLADVGSSESQPFSFVVPAHQRFVMVAQTNNGPTTCSYRFTLSGANCAQPAPAVSVLGLAGGVLLLLLIGQRAFIRRSRLSA